MTGPGVSGRICIRNCKPEKLTRGTWMQRKKGEEHPKKGRIRNSYADNWGNLKKIMTDQVALEKYVDNMFPGCGY